MCVIIHLDSYIGTGMSKTFQEAFKATLENFGIKAIWLSEKSGVSDQGISRLKVGARDIYLQTFSDLFDALPLDAKEFLLSRIMGDAIAPTISIAVLINQLDPSVEADRKKAHDAIMLIGEKFLYPTSSQKNIRKPTETQKEAELLKST